jgi:hypothetical protein
MMASTVHSARFTVPVADSQSPHGTWWPHTRSLADQLTHLVQAWPADRGRISRILYSPPDWDDRPHSVLVNGRRMKTGSFPRDDTHQVTLVMHDGQRRTISVIPPGTSRSDANGLLAGFGDGETERPGWENEGGHV